MTRFCALLLLLALRMPCYGQSTKSTDPYKGKPFKAGEIRALNLQIPVGNILISCKIKYTLLDDEDGLFYSFSKRYKAQINNAAVTWNTKGKIPQEIVDGFADRTIELTDKEIRKQPIRTKSMYYWFVVQDFNLDGKPDFAFIGDLGYHSAPVAYYVWVQIKGSLAYWHNLSGMPSSVTDAAKRIIGITSELDGHLTTKSYKIVKDTVLVPAGIAE